MNRFFKISLNVQIHNIVLLIIQSPCCTYNWIFVHFGHRHPFGSPKKQFLKGSQTHLATYQQRGIQLKSFQSFCERCLLAYLHTLA